jgi:hypothetical protein
MWYVLLAVRTALAAVLLVASLGKLRSTSAVGDFAASVVALGLAPARLARAFGIAVGAAELGVAALLLAPGAGRSGLLAATVLFGLLSLVVVRALRAGTPAECQCFGSGGGPLRADHAVRNAVLCAVAAGALAAELTAGTAGSLPPASASVLLPAAVAVVFGVAAALPVVHWDDLRYLLQPAR